jgi:hypothetical protein
MIKKLIIAALIIWGLVVFYRKFMQPVLEPFFGRYKGGVDLLGIKGED